MKYINWNQMSKLGLLEKINREVLHPIGLAVSRDPESGASYKIYISDDGKWEYADSVAYGVLNDTDVVECIKNMEVYEDEC